ncbi:hypothetical protein P9597_10590 [Aneurinibacillus migulanus]|uniref:hypothetical protein n=1 Tax=Aneurinibacillus migulanus TaxID=47500 RepID=UPI002E24676B|nr:hypothetical protein [Aneurinibacillus migulanus]
MELVKGRVLVKGQRVRVYLNLQRNGIFSIQDYKTGLVVGYAASVKLKSCSFVVRKAGQAKARAERVRNVHGFLVGDFDEADIKRPAEMTRCGYYCPFTTDTLVDEETREPVGPLRMAICRNRRVYFAKEELLCRTLFD